MQHILSPFPENAEEGEERDSGEESAQKERDDRKREEAEKEKEEEERRRELNDPSKPRPLHKTQSIFLRNLPPVITKSDIEAVSYN